MDPFTQVKSAEHMAKFNIKINFKSGHILWFLFNVNVKM